MSAFQFRLQTVLRIREDERHQRQRQLAEAQRAEDLLQAQRLELQAELAVHRSAHVKATSPGSLDVDRLLSAERFEALLRAEDRRLGEQLQTLSAEVERRRQALADAHREVRVLENLRERQAERHRQDEAARERRTLDEVGSYGYARKEHT